MHIQKSAVRNRLLQLVADEDFALLAPHLQPVELPKGERIALPHQRIEHYYFIENGLGSIVGVSPEGFKAEVGMVGHDGIVPTAVITGGDSSVHEILMQVGGRGLRIEAGLLAEVIESNARIRRLLLRFVQNLATQTAYTALSNAVHHTEERLARWLLMCHDRMDDDRLPLTHEYLSILLAVRRPSVTTALHILEGNHFIRATRGLITLRDRALMEKFAGDAYGVPEAEYARLFGPMRAP